MLNAFHSEILCMHLETFLKKSVKGNQNGYKWYMYANVDIWLLGKSGFSIMKVVYSFKQYALEWYPRELDQIVC